MPKNIDQIYVANPITTNVATDLIYIGQSPYGIGNDAAIAYSDFAAQFLSPSILPLSVSNGGTGIVTTTPYSVICAGTTATGAFQSLATLGAAGTVLTSNGAGALPSFQAAGGGSPWSAGAGTGSAIGGTASTSASPYSLCYGNTNVVSTSNPGCSILGGQNNTLGGGGNNTVMVAGDHHTGGGNSSAILCGSNNVMNGCNRSAILNGHGNAIGGDYSLVAGESGTCSGSYAFSHGNQSDADGNYSFSMGYQTKAHGNYQFVFGSNNTRAGVAYTNCFAFGDNVVGNASYAFAFGSNSTIASGSYSFAFGQQATANGVGSIAWGPNSSAQGDYSVCIGYQCVAASGSNNVCLGSLAYSGTHSHCFVASDGTSGAQHPTLDNQFYVDYANGMIFGISGVYVVAIDASGNLINKQGVADQSYSRQVPTTGFSITIGAGVKTLVLVPGSQLATGTIIMPATPIDGQIIVVSAEAAGVTALTVNANTGQTIGNAPTTIAAGQGFSYQYNLANTNWMPLYQAASGGATTWNGYGTSSVKGGGSGITSGNYSLVFGNGANASGNNNFIFGVSATDSSASGVFVAGDASGDINPPATANLWTVNYTNGYQFQQHGLNVFKIDVNGNMINIKGMSDQSYVISTPTTGGTVTIAATQRRAVINPAGTLATLTVSLPTGIKGQLVTISCTQVITALTVSSAGNTVTAAPAALAAGQSFTMIYDLASTTWFPG